MIIAIDYDGTYASDPQTFNNIIHLLKDAGHTVICVTGRVGESPADDIVCNTIGQLVPVIFAGTESKHNAARILGYDVDIWIDDNPSTIEKQRSTGGGWSLD